MTKSRKLADNNKGKEANARKWTTAAPSRNIESRSHMAVQACCRDRGSDRSLRAVRIAFNLGNNYGVFKAVDGVHTTCCVNFLESFLLPITIGLVISAVGIYVQRPIGFLLSLIGLLAIAFTYLAWYLGTLSIMRHAEVGSFSQLPSQRQHVLTLADASWWDIWVLSLTILLILWQSKKLFRSLRTADWKRNRKPGEQRVS